MGVRGLGIEGEINVFGPPPPTQAGKPSAEAEKIVAAERVKVSLQNPTPNEASAGRLICSNCHCVSHQDFLLDPSWLTCFEAACIDELGRNESPRCRSVKHR